MASADDFSREFFEEVIQEAVTRFGMTVHRETYFVSDGHHHVTVEARSRAPNRAIEYVRAVFARCAERGEIMIKRGNPEAESFEDFATGSWNSGYARFSIQNREPAQEGISFSDADWRKVFSTPGV